jgi:hypothetical protein
MFMEVSFSRVYSLNSWCELLMMLSAREIFYEKVTFSPMLLRAVIHHHSILFVILLSLSLSL